MVLTSPPPMCCFNSPSVGGLFTYTLALTCPQRKQSGAGGSGDLTGQATSPELNGASGKYGC